MKPITYLVNAGCNEHCLFCFNHWRENEQMQTLSRTDQLHVLDSIIALSPSMLIFSGGEPLLSGHLVDLLAYVRKKTMIPLSIQTNATLLTLPLAQQLRQYDTSYLFVSLHGPPAIHNALTGGFFYDKTITGITHAIRAGIPVVLNIVVTKKNIMILPAFLRTLSHHDISVVQLSALYAAGSALLHPDLFPSLDEQRKLIFSLNGMAFPFPVTLHAFEKSLLVGTHFISDMCGAGEEELAVFPNGNVTLCPAWEQTYGNILRDEWSLIEKNIERGIIQEKEIKALCHECGGCALSRKAAA